MRVHGIDRQLMPHSCPESGVQWFLATAGGFHGAAECEQLRRLLVVAGMWVAGLLRNIEVCYACRFATWHCRWEALSRKANQLPSHICAGRRSGQLSAAARQGTGDHAPVPCRLCYQWNVCVVCASVSLELACPPTSTPTAPLASTVTTLHASQRDGQCTISHCAQISNGVRHLRRGLRADLCCLVARASMTFKTIKQCCFSLLLRCRLLSPLCANGCLSSSELEMPTLASAHRATV
jgi:hypothetical protein